MCAGRTAQRACRCRWACQTLLNWQQGREARTLLGTLLSEGPGTHPTCCQSPAPHTSRTSWVPRSARTERPRNAQRGAMMVRTLPQVKQRTGMIILRRLLYSWVAAPAGAPARLLAAAASRRLVLSPSRAACNCDCPVGYALDWAGGDARGHQTSGWRAGFACAPCPACCARQPVLCALGTSYRTASSCPDIRMRVVGLDRCKHPTRL